MVCFYIYLGCFGGSTPTPTNDRTKEGE